MLVSNKLNVDELGQLSRKRWLYRFLPIQIRRQVKRFIMKQLTGADPDSERAKRDKKVLQILDEKYGHWHSIHLSRVVNRNGEPIPWYTYPAIEYIDQLDFQDKEVFEWGSGNSSLYWAKVSKNVISVEDNPYWYNEVRESTSNNLTLMFITDKGEYVNAIALTARKYDIIIVDGSYRYECTLIAREYLRDGGLIILDNSDWLPKSASTLREAGLLQVDMSGFGPIAQYTFTTSFFFHRNSDIKNKKGQQPYPSNGSIAVPAHFLNQEPR